MTRPWLFPVLFSLVLLAAAALRLPNLPNRPLHGDEAINTFKTNELFESGKFEYDPHEYHGPTLYFASLPGLKLAGIYAQSTESTFRIVPVLFGLLTITLVYFLRDGLGDWESLAAAALAAFSPALVFYNRYFIHESPLVFFTFLAIVAGWRYARSRHVAWAITAGAALGLMHATKETWVISIAAMVWGILGAIACARLIDRRPLVPTHPLRWKVLLAACVVALCVSAVLFSSFGRHPRGPVDSVLTYIEYFKRGTGDTDHVHPWHYYLKLLLWTQPVQGRSPITTEALILFLAALGAALSLRRQPTATSDSPIDTIFSPHSSFIIHRSSFPPLLRFLAFYCLTNIAFYSFIKYKTPWCMTGFLHAATLLAGVAAVALVRRMPNTATKVFVTMLLAAGLAHLGYQAYRTSHVYPDDYRRNAYVYSQPLRQAVELSDRLHALADVHPAGRNLVIHVFTKDCWPLPWYVRDLPDVSYYPDEIRPGPAADVLIINIEQIEPLEAAIDVGLYANPVHYGLRPKIPSLRVYIKKELWNALVSKM